MNVLDIAKAAEFFNDLLQTIAVDEFNQELRDNATTALAVLRERILNRECEPGYDCPHYWISTAFQRPSEKDASETGMVMAVKGNGPDAYVTVVKWSYCTPKAYPWWMSYPRRPA